MTTQEAQKSAYQNRAAKSREKYQQELAAYNANKKAAAKADAAPAAEAVPSKKRKKSEDGEKKKVAFQCSNEIRPRLSPFYVPHRKRRRAKRRMCSGRLTP